MALFWLPEDQENILNHIAGKSMTENKNSYLGD
jgi:enhancing lycopene biosynthesis protein 2